MAMAEEIWCYGSPEEGALPGWAVVREGFLEKAAFKPRPEE